MPIQNDAEHLKITETLACGYTSESILSESYLMNTNILVLWTNVALALEGLRVGAMC